MQDNEAIIIIIVIGNFCSYIKPVFNTSVFRLPDGASLFDIIWYPIAQLSYTKWIRESDVTTEYETN